MNDMHNVTIAQGDESKGKHENGSGEGTLVNGVINTSHDKTGGKA